MGVCLFGYITTLTIHRSCSGGIKEIARSGEFSYRCNAWRALSKKKKRKKAAGGELALEMDRIHFCLLEIQGSNWLRTVTEAGGI